ncbi:site-specific integrase [Leptospira fletcheri]|uniref:Site-specific integrase n=1 Tax=Leptospira fletcheri TaxID=2484981 RepID=A0A4R9GFJ1_9LEPT|nr:tyrosine-type recombinase/integrase [Leptospira fletcheri]TGK11420.1 site-specific integrase [Leptospira fletcheri]
MNSVDSLQPTELLEAGSLSKETRKAYLTKQEMGRIIKVAKGNERHFLWIQMIYSFGLHISELVFLRVRDVDWEKNLVHIGSSKKSETRDLSLTCSLSLRRLLWFACERKSGDEFLFSGRNGNVHPRTIQKMFSKLEKETGLSVSITILRRSLATHLREVGWGRKKIQHQLGLCSTRSVDALLSGVPLPSQGDSFPLDEILSLAA